MFSYANDLLNQLCARGPLQSQEFDVVLFREVVPTIYNITEGRTLPNSRDYFRVNIMTIY